MICKRSDNIISSLGFTTEENYRNVKAGHLGIRRYEGLFGLPEPFLASLIDTQRLNERFLQLESSPTVNYTPLEKAAILSVAEALKTANLDAAANNVLFVLSTTKGNVHLLDENEKNVSDSLKLWHSAQRIARFFGNQNQPVTVSNACISGASALLVAKQELEAKRYRYAVVVGVDLLSKFIISGFQSFLALSDEPCRPFDIARKGLNLGEAAATMILENKEESECTPEDILFLNGAVRNDANHISGPSRTGEGSYLALHKTLGDLNPAEIAFVNAHGTATPYNDEMESIALTRAGLEQVPVNSLKGYFGHTLGAAGVLESIISICALTENTALKTSGFNELGVTHLVNVTTQNTATTKNYCLKMLSGFGGCNAVLLFKKGGLAR